MFTRKCEMCGMEFQTPSSRAKYCIYCRDKVQVQRNRAYAEKKKQGSAVSIGSEQKCPQCGKIFTVTSGSQKYCKECASTKKRKKVQPTAEYLKENYDYIRFNVPKGEGDEIKAYAQELGMTVKDLMLAALKEYKCIGRKFEIKLGDLVLPYYFYSLEDIQNSLKSFSDIISFELIEGDKKTIMSKLKEREKRYFAYIKFFICDNIKYGIVGGKTNNYTSDVSFDYDYAGGLRHISRSFLIHNNFEWYEGILLIRCKDIFTNDQQALLLESFIQRQFNLFDS